MDEVQQTVRLLSPALSRRILIAPPSRHASCWRIFGGGLTAEVAEHTNLGLCSYILRGPDGKALSEGLEGNLQSALSLSVELIRQLCSEGSQATA